MGWLEFQAWVRTLNRSRQDQGPDPETWNQASRDNFADLDAKRQAMRAGRA